MQTESITEQSPALSEVGSVSRTVSAFVQLTKPSIMLLVLFTGMTALIMEGSLLDDPWRFSLVLLGLFLCGGSANAFNQYFERDIDSRMTRTRKRRPLPMRQITPAAALSFAIGIGLGGLVLFAVVFNLLTAGLALATLLFYSLFYTLYLKPTTPQNIVIGGVAGAMAPVGAWAAATGGTSWEPWIMFAVVFLWTPPHFWALASFCSDDYRKVGLPMLPVVRDKATTGRQILTYTIVVVAVSLTLALVGSGLMYLVVALALGVEFIRQAYGARNGASIGAYRKLFGYSIVYLLSLFAAMIVDHLFWFPVL